MKTTILALSASVALISVLASVGCTAPVQTYDPNTEDNQTSKSSKDKDTDKDKKSSNKSSNSNSSSSSSSSGSTQTPPAQQTPPDNTIPPGTQTPPGGEQGEACFAQCIAGNPAAKQIDDAFLACLDGGGNEQTCGQQADQACQQNQAACQLLDQCDQQCFGGEQGGEQP